MRIKVYFTLKILLRRKIGAIMSVIKIFGGKKYDLKGYAHH